jgi:hypothetical protein
MPYISTALTGVVIFDEHLYRPTGLVGFWMNKVTTRFVAEAVRAAPKDTGELAAGISGDVKQIGPKQVQGTISSSAPYTMFVIRGTGFPVKGHEGRIYTTKGFGTRNIEDAYVELWGVVNRTTGKFSRKGRGDGTFRGRRQQHMVRKKGYWLKLPFRSASGGPVLAFSVRGQEPNNFLFEAWKVTGYTHSAIRRSGASFPDLG